ncbi:MAG: Transglutaminase-like superfamily protein [Candidatus Methanofastidiosum methylothiophilum]|uniref:Transglutaminase-like superfamily protein n=1 Tax=Candidatus Methanofastidiosum methylothiophilum TaxID=1705564 RepID=A0A150ITV0_9EURY|nr:MAG: Transglutaminase-like superfamily protein [Candidatus Methanofastidiosum methylthiophilus]KYC48441.1 MAG: Transglutaminase-like superfamily protein [Candidatus Methanofastidiosum methylthiophilus]KYC51047.1 MAG: Transglutaminase-like superfamily protein [Candidatus Methanofastidiosum methylthiophilus]
MKRAGIVLALVFLITVATFSGCVSQKKEDNGVDVNTTPPQTGKTVSYVKARINVAQPYDISDLNSSRQKVVIIRDSGIRLEAIVTLYGETYVFDDTTRIPIVETEEDALKVINSFPEDVLPYVVGMELEEGIWGTGTVHWTEHMRNRIALRYAKEDADYNLYGTAYLIMKDQKTRIRVDESPYLKDGYEYWWMQGATETLSTSKALGIGPYATLYASLMRSMMIPTKIVYGLYYDLEAGGVWKPYVWNEIYFKGKWVPVDPYREQFGTLSRYYLKLYETVDLLELNNDFACYRSNFEGKGCKPFEIQILEQGTVLESEINK